MTAETINIWLYVEPVEEAQGAARPLLSSSRFERYEHDFGAVTAAGVARGSGVPDR